MRPSLSHLLIAGFHETAVAVQSEREREKCNEFNLAIEKQHANLSDLNRKTFCLRLLIY